MVEGSITHAEKDKQKRPWFLIVVITIFTMVHAIQAAGVGLVIPLIIDKTAEVSIYLSRVSLELFPYVWFINIYLGLVSGWYVYILINLYKGSKYGMYLLLFTTILIPFVTAGIWLFIQNFSPEIFLSSQQSNLYTSDILKSAIYSAIVLVPIISLLVYESRHYFVNAKAPLSLREKMFILLIFVVSVLPSSTYFAYAKFTDQTAEQNRRIVSEEAGFKLLVPSYLPQEIQMNRKVKVIRSDKLNLTMYRQVFDLPLKDIAKGDYVEIQLIVFDQGKNIRRESLDLILNLQEDKENYESTVFENSNSGFAYVKDLTGKDDEEIGFSILFITKDGIICSIVGFNVSKDEFLKIANSIQ